MALNTGAYTQNIEVDGLMGETLKKAATTAANVELIEFLKGPNSILHGQMNPGGLLNIVTKSPLATPHYSARRAAIGIAAVSAYGLVAAFALPETRGVRMDGQGPTATAAKQPPSSRTPLASSALRAVDAGIIHQVRERV